MLALGPRWIHRQAALLLALTCERTSSFDQGHCTTPLLLIFSNLTSHVKESQLQIHTWLGQLLFSNAWLDLKTKPYTALSTKRKEKLLHTATVNSPSSFFCLMAKNASHCLKESPALHHFLLVWRECTQHCRQHYTTLHNTPTVFCFVLVKAFQVAWGCGPLLFKLMLTAQYDRKECSCSVLHFLDNVNPMVPNVFWLLTSPIFGDRRGLLFCHMIAGIDQNVSCSCSCKGKITIVWCSKRICNNI